MFTADVHSALPSLLAETGHATATATAPTAPRELHFPDDCKAGVYIIVCRRLPGSFKIGFTSDINARLWHATYDAFGKTHKWYAFAVLFQFRDTTMRAGAGAAGPVYRPAERDELEWIEQQVEAEILRDTVDHHDDTMGTEWRTDMLLDECVERIREVVGAVTKGLHENGVAPDVREEWHFRTSKLHKVCTVHRRRARKWAQALLGRWKAAAASLALAEASASTRPTSTEPMASSAPIWHERDYQTATIARCVARLRDGSSPRMYVDLATGAGKSYIMYKTFAELGARHLLIFSPRRDINVQNVQQKYVQLLSLPESRVVVNFSDAASVSAATATAATGTEAAYVLVACPQQPQTLESVREFLEQRRLTEVSVWFDEAHYAVESWVHARDATKRFFLDDPMFTHRVFTSASPDKELVDVHPEVFGERFCPIAVSELIAQGWLCPIAPYIYQGQSHAVDICRYSLCHFVEFQSSYGFSFHRNRENASQMFVQHATLYLRGQTKVHPFLVLGEDYRGTREPAMVELRRRLQYNCYDIATYQKTPHSMGYVCRMFTMGYDFAGIDYLLMCDPKTSEKDIKQCIGRGTRPDKLGPRGTNLRKRLHVMLPVYIESGDDAHEYDSIRQVLRYLIFDVGLPLHTMMTPPAYRGDGGGGASRTSPTSPCKYAGTETMEAMLLNVLGDSRTSAWTAHRLARLLRRHDTHDYAAYTKLRAARPELFLPTDPFVACARQFRWMDTHRPNPFYDAPACKRRVGELVDEHDLDLDGMDTEDAVETLHALDSRIPRMVLERFYGVAVY